MQKYEGRFNGRDCKASKRMPNSWSVEMLLSGDPGQPHGDRGMQPTYSSTQVETTASLNYCFNPLLVISWTHEHRCQTDAIYLRSTSALLAQKLLGKLQQLKDLCVRKDAIGIS